MRIIIIIGLIFLFFGGTVKAEDSQLGNCILYDLKDNKVRLSDYKGKPLVLWFWTTWCPYCRRQIPGLNDIYSELKLSGVELIAINIDERKERIVRFLKSYPINFDTLSDRNGDCAFSFGLVGVPTYIFIDKNGNVQFRNNYFPKDKYKELLLD